MSGRKQHYIPQCLLRQFAAKRTKAATHVVVYKRGRSPFTTATEGIAAARDFYSAVAQPGVRELDDEITAYENKLAPMLEYLRNSGGSATVDADVAAEVVAHLTSRGAFIRDVFSSGVQDMLALFGSLFQTEDASRHFLGIDDAAPAELLLNEIENVYDELPGEVSSKLPRPLFKRLVRVLVREDFQSLHSTIAPQVGLVIERLQQELPLVAQRGHAKALRETLAPDQRVRALESLEWVVMEYETESLVLPDCVALAELSDGSLGPLQIQGDERFSRVLLPLSDRRLLMGQPKDAAQRALTAQEFNRFAAESCWEFFIASQQSEDLATLATEIRRRPRDHMKAALIDVAKKFSARNNAPGPVSSEPGNRPASMDTASRRFSVSFVDFSDQEHAERVAGVVASIAEAVGQHLPLNRLESVTFANDYAAALRSVDRGDPRLGPLVSTNDDCGIGVAMAPLVVRDGQVRACVVGRSWIAIALVDEEDDNHRIAVHTLVSMLARISFVELLDNSLPGVLLRPLPDVWNSFLFEQVEGVCSAYFSARVAAPLAPEVGDSYRTLFCSVLARANLEVPMARFAYRTHGQLDAFLGKVAELISPVLVHCASLVGHFDGLEASPFDDHGVLSAALQGSDLERWFDVFGRDLRRNHEDIGRWSSLDEFISLTVHVERHLWRYGVFPWRADDGRVRVEVPLSTDALALGSRS